MAQLVKNPPAMQETWVQFLSWEYPLRREWLPTPVLWPGEFHGLYSPWGCKESDTTEWFSLSLWLSGDIWFNYKKSEQAEIGHKRAGTVCNIVTPPLTEGMLSCSLGRKNPTFEYQFSPRPWAKAITIKIFHVLFTFLRSRRTKENFIFVLHLCVTWKKI